MASEHEGVIQFLTEQQARRFEEARRREDGLTLTYRASLGFLLATWRFIVVTRAAFFALAATGLQHILYNIGAFLDTSRLVAVIETWQGIPTALLKVVRLITAGDAANLVACMILAIGIVTIAIDLVLHVLQRRCVIRGTEAERYLHIEGLFMEIQNRAVWIALPFWVARILVITFVILALSYLGIATKEA